MRVLSFLMVATWMLPGTASLAAVKSPAGAWSVVTQPIRVVNGSPVLFKVRAPRNVQSLAGRWLDHEIAFALDPRTKLWYALAGASLETRPGVYTVDLQGTTAAGQTLSYKRQVAVQHQRYPKVLLKVPDRYTAPNPDDQKKIEADQKTKADAFKTLSADRQWNGNFLPPVKAEISDVFGVQRIFNGAVKSTHQGLDFRVPGGTPVDAVNDGTVILARSLFFEGNCVVLDHGQGLLTLYLHLSRIDVQEGEHVRKGQPIAVSGGTGRATGPHLHLAVRWQGVYLNPAGLLALKVP